MPHIFSVSPEELHRVLVNGGLNLIAAIITLAIGWTIARLVSRWLRFALDRWPRFDRTLKPLVTKLAHYLILAVTLIIVLQRFGVETTSLIAVLGAAGLAIGLALQGTLSNVASGAMLLVLRPFQIGDYIDVNGTGGTVREIGLFTTTLVSADLVFVSMPNSLIFANTIINYSREPTRRINLTVRIDYKDDIEKAQKIALDVIEADSRIFKQPAPMVPVGELGLSSVDLILRCWVSNAEYWNVLFDLQKTIKLRFDAEGITIPLPQQVTTMRPAPSK
jgi:small conductance mechanosensitive channel